MAPLVVAYRLAAFDRPLRTEPSRVGGRFHRPEGRDPTQYLCLHPLGPWAELMRGSDLQTPEQVLAVRQRSWAVRVDLEGLPRVGFEEAVTYGIDPADLVGDDHEPCRALADRLRLTALPGFAVPSAALPGTDNVVLFGARAAAPYALEPAGAIDLPSTLTAHDGRPVRTLLDRVRFRDRPHAALEAWRAGGPFRFREPGWALRAA
jgi:hypothetical protein